MEDEVRVDVSEVAALADAILEAGPQIQRKIAREIMREALREPRERIKRWADSHKRTGRVSRNLSQVRIKKIRNGTAVGGDIAFVYFRMDSKKTKTSKNGKNRKPEPATIAHWISNGTQGHEIVRKNPSRGGILGGLFRRSRRRKPAYFLKGIRGDGFLKTARVSQEEAMRRFGEEAARHIEQYLQTLGR